MVLPDVTVAAGGGTFVDPILYASQDVEVTGANPPPAAARGSRSDREPPRPPGRRRLG
jgi:hypothetical protein